MQIEVIQGDITATAADAIVVNLFEGVESPAGATGAVDRALDGAISRLIADGDLSGKNGEVVVLHTLGKIPAKRVLVAGLGKADDFDTLKARRVAAEVVRAARKAKVRHLASIVHGAGIGGQDPRESTIALVEGTILGHYRFSRRKSTPPEDGVERFSVVEMDAARLEAVQEAARAGEILAQAQVWARDAANEPSNVMTPTRLAEEARALAEETGLEVEILERHTLRAMGFRAFLAVAQGSQEPPRLIVLRYTGDPESTRPPIGLVGKGITFDTGGISIKPAANMDYMKGDMGGAAAVIGAMGAIARLKPKVNVIGITPCTENMPSGTAYKPGDVITAKNGKTIEVINTDAEGRVVLSDALVYAGELGCSPIVDIATLTGAISVSLADVCAGIMGTDQKVIDEVMFAGQQEGERYWQLPLYEEYAEMIKGSTGDWLNAASGGAGSITAAMFLKQFVPDGTPWAHLDVAGTDWASKDKGEITKGCTGWGARTLVRFVLNQASA